MVVAIKEINELVRAARCMVDYQRSVIIDASNYDYAEQIALFVDLVHALEAFDKSQTIERSDKL